LKQECAEGFGFQTSKKIHKFKQAPRPFFENLRLNC